MVNDLGGLPPSHHDMSLTEFHTLLDSMPSLRVMTISPHLDAPKNYLRIQALLNRYSFLCVFYVHKYNISQRSYALGPLNTHFIKTL